MDIFFKFIEKLINFFNYSRIMASPLLIGVIIGIFVYASKTDEIGLVIAIAIAVCGLVCGILYANWAKRKFGTTEFMASLNATPDIDDAIRDPKTENK